MSKINSREGLLEREREIMRLLGLLLEAGLDFIVVGGYAVLTYKKRFSIDLDLVVNNIDLAKFEELFKKEGYFLHYEKNIALLYGENFKRYEKKMKNLAVDIDLLINGLVSRTTDATWSFDYIKRHSVVRKIEGFEFLTPSRELLIAMKLHSGRLSDIRDIVALMPCDEKELKKHLMKGSFNKLLESIKKQATLLDKPQFDDGFKGIFGIHVYNEKDVIETKKIIKEILRLKNNL